MKTEHFNNLNESETERLSILLEECSEVIQICGKILRHGYESFNPFDKDKVTNRVLLAKELGDVLLALEMLKDSGDINENFPDNFKELKKLTIQKYLHHQED